MPLSTLDAINTRYSCRAFNGVAPSDKDLESIALAAAASPSGMNTQRWRIIVVKNKDLISDMEAEAFKNLQALPDQSAYNRIISRGGKVFYSAPCMIVVPIEPTEPSASSIFDCGIVSENIALAATSLGINSLICGMAAFCFSGDKREEFMKRLNFPEGYEIGIAVLLGYAENSGGSPHKVDESKISWIE
jgi:nitroreductase